MLCRHSRYLLLLLILLLERATGSRRLPQDEGILLWQVYESAER